MSSLLETKKITKRFGTFSANESIDFDLQRGEIHAIVGENGAGKSTLMKILSGLLRATEGSLYFQEKEVHFSSVLDATGVGIGMVHQHFMLVEELTVLENFILGYEPSSHGVISFDRALIDFNRLQSDADRQIDPHVLVKHLSIGERQRLEILKLLHRRCECMIFDEPTAVLPPQEIDRFLSFLRELKAKNHSLILVTHKLKEVFAVADRITVLKQGRKVGTFEVSKTSPSEIAEAMIGEKIRSSSAIKLSLSEKDSYVRVKNLKTRRISDLSLDISRGEILGVAGIEGHGQRDLFLALAGLESMISGTVSLGENEVQHFSPLERRKFGMVWVSEDRHGEAMVASMSISENFYLDDWFERGWINSIPRMRLKDQAEKAIKDWDIRVPNGNAEAGELSGGNQQKLVMARDIGKAPRFLMVAQPTRGVDFKSSQLVQEKIQNLAERNRTSIILFSSDLDELLKISHRILVLRDFRVSAIFANNESEDILRKKIGEAMLCQSSSR